ncbi:MAG TPA: S9 family peptidase [Bacteroidales bacterium]|nr:S9 family peptidase [Bacteroidales bacterium]
MKRFVLLMAFTFSLLTVQATKPKLELDSVVTGKYNALTLPEMKPMLDAKYYTCLDESGQHIISYAFLTGKQTEVLFDLSTVKGEGPDQIAGYAFSPNEAKILVWTEKKPIYRRSYLTDYYVYDRKRNTIEPLSVNGSQRNASFSPDGRSIAFARDNNLFIKRLDFGTELQVTSDGALNSIVNGVSDWVYEEEFVETRAYDWSADSKFLAYVRFNEKEIPFYTFSLYGAFVSKQKREKYYPGQFSFKYPSSGEPNSVVSVWAFNIQTRSSRQMNIPIAQEDYIPRIRFTRNSSQLAVMTLNRAQNTFKMFYANPKSAQSTLILTDQSDTYLDPMLDAIQFSSKYFTYVSEKDGFRHLYLYGANGGLQKQLTSGKWDLTKYIGCDTIKNVFYYQSDEDDATRRSVYSVDLKGKKVCLTLRKGVSDAFFNSDHTYSVQTWSDINTPPVYTLNDPAGQELRVIQSNKKLKGELADFGFKDKQFIKVPAADGQLLNGWLLKPTDFSDHVKYPVVMVQYSGPDSQLALDAYDFDWEYSLAQEGFVVICVDGRGTGGRGVAFRKSTYSNLGLQETQDQIAVADWVKSQPWADGSRIGIWGWSYGGYMTLMCMTDEKSSFKAGVAVAPVCDWHYYNTVYTERFMRTPKENPDGYEKSSPLLRAAHLKGNLLLIHGLADDNVRSNQSLDMTEALIRAGKQFDMQVYPTSNHSILGDTYRMHLYRKMFDFFKQNL